MKKIAFIAICIMSLVGFSSCGSSSPCGLAKAKKIKQIPNQLDSNTILVAENSTE
jgi:hypothetical protein